MNTHEKYRVTRTRAWLIHLGLSVLLLLPVLGLVFFAWFPAPWFEVQATAAILVVLVGVHLVLGPGLTAVVFRPGKKGLVFDLVVIGVLQLAALAYGAWAIHTERPAWIVFSVDRYVPLAEKDVDRAEAVAAGFRPAVLAGPRYVFAEMPLGRAFQQLQDEVLFQGRPDLEQRPEFWKPFPRGREAVLGAAIPLAALVSDRPERADALAERARDLGLEPSTARFLPVPGKKDDFAALLDPETARVLDVVRMNPWVRRR